MCHSRYGLLKNPHCSMAMSVEHRSTFEALLLVMVTSSMSEKFTSGTIIPQHTKRKKNMQEKLLGTHMHCSYCQYTRNFSLRFISLNKKNSVPEITVKQYRLNTVQLHILYCKIYLNFVSTCIIQS